MGREGVLHKNELHLCMLLNIFIALIFIELLSAYDLNGDGEISEEELFLIVDDMLHNKDNSQHIVSVRTCMVIIYLNGLEGKVPSDIEIVEYTKMQLNWHLVPF